MELILYAIPSAILVATIVISRIVRGGFSEYINDLEQKVGELEGVLNLTFMKELLDFFVSSKASKAAERVVSHANINCFYTCYSFDCQCQFQKRWPVQSFVHIKHNSPHIHN